MVPGLSTTWRSVRKEIISRNTTDLRLPGKQRRARTAECLDAKVTVETDLLAAYQSASIPNLGGWVTDDE